MRWFRIPIALVVVAASVWVGLPTAASAAYPGANGRIAFLRHGDVYTVRPDGTALQRLTFTATAGGDGVDATPVWSPNGRKIAYASRKAGSWDIWVMNADGSAKHRVTFSSGLLETDPTWSPDGRWIAFSSDRGEPYQGQAIFKTRSTAPYGKPIRLTHPGLNESGNDNVDWAPRWSPLGGTIMFTREFVYGGEPPGFELFTVASGGGAASRVQTGIGDAWLGDWAPRARSVAWTSANDSEDPDYYYPPIDIWMRSLDGTVRRVTPGNDANVDTRWPAWAPSATRLAYQRYTYSTDQTDIWTIKPDGTGARLVIANAFQPNWQPIVG